jgi:4,5:9,10-diseco-3-hydroxy-5,9,17-trioxoandrosta-1(10),2-diene-4-oate hydrolase
MLAQAQDLCIQVGDVKTRYWEFGESSSPVLFVHGIGSFIEHWERNLTEFSKHHRVYALDLVGFGLTEKPMISYSIPLLAKFVQDFMNVKGIKSASVIGHSLGATVASELCLLNPNIVDKLILLDGGLFGRKVGATFRILSVPFVGEWFMRPNRDRTEQFLKLMFFDQTLVTEESVDIAFERNARPGSAKAFLKTLRSMGNVFGTKRALVNRMIENKNLLTSPTLIIWGKNDNILPVEYAYKAAEILPNVTLQIFDNCGHMPQIECSEKFNDLAISCVAE